MRHLPPHRSMMSRAVDLVDNKTDRVETDTAVFSSAVRQLEEQVKRMPSASRLQLDQGEYGQQCHLPCVSLEALRLQHPKCGQRHRRNLGEKRAELTLWNFQPFKLHKEHLEQIGIGKTAAMALPGALQNLSEWCFLQDHGGGHAAVSRQLLPPRHVCGKFGTEQLHQVTQRGRTGANVRLRFQCRFQGLEGMHHESLAHGPLKRRVHGKSEPCRQVQHDLPPNKVRCSKLCRRQRRVRERTHASR
mmetsp:Transcript_8348/g.23214  ORF Transcript_8348/g.23214 Transcript_8348/m.23214 type:complete len:246 (+) Transcript_8348:1145-1882(+)